MNNQHVNLTRLVTLTRRKRALQWTAKASMAVHECSLFRMIRLINALCCSCNQCL